MSKPKNLCFGTFSGVFGPSWQDFSQKLLITTFFTLGLSNRLGISFFSLTGHFWCWWKPKCSSPIATKGFGGAVSPLFDPAFNGSVPHFSYKEMLDLQENNLFTLALFNIFFSKKPTSIFILLLTPLKPKAEEGIHFRKPNIPSSYSMSSQINTL